MPGARASWNTLANIPLSFEIDLDDTPFSTQISSNVWNWFLDDITEIRIQLGNAHFATRGSGDIFLAAFDAKGSLTWVAQAGGKITRESFITGTESIGNQVISGFPVSFSATSHAASKFVEMSMLTGDGRVRT